MLVCQADQISDDLTGIFAVDPLNRLVSGIRDFFGIFGELDLGDKIACFFVLNGRQLVDTAKGWAILGGDQIGAHTPGIDGCAL